MPVDDKDDEKADVNCSPSKDNEDTVVKVTRPQGRLVYHEHQSLLSPTIYKHIFLYIIIYYYYYLSAPDF